MKSLVMAWGLTLALFSADVAQAGPRPLFFIGPDGRIYVLRPTSPRGKRSRPPVRRPNVKPRPKRPVKNRNRGVYPPMPRPDIHGRPFSVYSAGQMQRLVNWIRNHPTWTPSRKQSQIRWWRKQNEWMKKQNNNHLRRSFGPFGGR